MMRFEKPNSPFYPDKPLPPDKFFGREELLQEIWKRDLEPVLKHNRTQTVWISGERGIGKSSLAIYLLDLAEKEGLMPLKINLSRIHTVDDLIQNIIYAILDYGSRSKDPVSRFIKESFQKYFESIEIQIPILGGLKTQINKAALEKDIPQYKRNFEDFLKSFIQKVKQNNYLGVFLLLDEINGLALEPEFASFLKGLSDNLDPYLSLMFMICGTEEKRQAIIKNHKSTDRVFRSIYEVLPIPTNKLTEYFIKEFESCDIEINEIDAEIMAEHSHGQPRFAQIIGDNVFYINEYWTIDSKDCFQGLITAFIEIGEKFIKPLYNEIQSAEYKKLIKKITTQTRNLSFSRNEVCKNLSDKDKKTFDNFIKRMEALGFIKKEGKGKYTFDNSQTKAYLAYSTELE